MLSFIKQVSKTAIFMVTLILEISWYVMVRFVSLTLALWVSWKLGMRASLNDILYSFTAQDVDGMTKAILSVTQFDNGLNRAVLSQDVEQMLGRYSGVDLGSLSMTDC